MQELAANRSLEISSKEYVVDAIFGKIREEDRKRSVEELQLDGAIFKVLFLKRNPLIVNDLLPILKSRLASQEFQADFLRQYQKKITKEKEILLLDEKKCRAAGSDPRFYTYQLPALERQLALTSLDDYLGFLRDPAESHYGIVESLVTDYAHLNSGQNGTMYVEENFYLYQIGSFLYEQYLPKASLFERFENSNAQILRNIYKKLDIDLEAVDQQFAKYGLLSVNDNVQIFNSKESQSIVDDRVRLHYWIAVPSDLLAAIKETIARQWVKDIAFNVEHISETVLALEAREYGSLFSFEALQLPAISKLYDEERYDDALWIKVDKRKSSMTFEELCADFPELHGKVVTQVVHLELTQKNGLNFISHIDHEYILYTVDEYADRQQDSRIKGHKKLKTFKIDNAQIPFEFRFNGRYFIFLTLDAYFKNKALILEYFSAVPSD